MLPLHRDWHRKYAPWPKETLDSYLTLLHQLELGRKYKKEVLHAAARFLGMSTGNSEEHLECWEQMGVVRFLPDDFFELNSEHAVFQPSTPPRKPITVAGRDQFIMSSR